MKNKNKKRQKGFSLIELLIVMVIIGLLASLVGPKMFSKVGKSKQKSAKAQISLFETSLDMYRLDMGKYPATDVGLSALRVKPDDNDKWDGPYLPKQIPLDPWGNPYHYESPSEHGDYEIISYGADGTEGGEGEDQDIVSWKDLEKG
jgi:general secretion pathway protein G